MSTDSLTMRARRWYDTFNTPGHDDDAFVFTNDEVADILLEALQDELALHVYAMLKYARLCGWKVSLTPDVLAGGKVDRVFGTKALTIRVGPPRKRNQQAQITGYVHAETPGDTER